MNGGHIIIGLAIVLELYSNNISKFCDSRGLRHCAMDPSSLESNLALLLKCLSFNGGGFSLGSGGNVDGVTTDVDNSNHFFRRAQPMEPVSDQQ